MRDFSLTDTRFKNMLNINNKIKMLVKRFFSLAL